MTGKQGAIIALTIFGLLNAVAKNATIRLDVDATDVAKNLLHARVEIPTTPGKLTLYYPKWIPGEHSPSGPINSVTGLKFSANGKPIEWQRDAEDMFQFNVTVPAGADSVEVALDFFPSGGGGGYSAGDSATAKLLILSWNQLLLYPKSERPLAMEFSASLKLPANWKFASALPTEITTRNEPGKIQFSPAPLETLIDSPVIAGEFFRRIDLGEIKKTPHRLNIVADTQSAIELKSEDEVRFRNLVREANALFGAHHYRGYDFLVTLSDKVAHFGLEHHESSDDRFAEDYFTDENSRALSAELMPHELVHSWNGKYRRPTGLATPDYQQPMRGELLWIYEGLTDYLGKVLAARSGLMTETNFRSAFALTAAALDHRNGRSWRSLADTTVSAQLVYDAPGVGTSRRRGPDFYPEGDLIWLEVDTLIRQQSQSKKSLDDFCRQFYGGENGAPKVVGYDLNDLIRTLNEVTPFDWKSFFQKRIYEINLRAPIGGIENGGWKLIYTNEPSALLKIREDKRKYTDVNYSLGFTLGTDGVIGDVLPGSTADKAGIFQGMKLVAVDGRAWSAKILRDTLKTAVTNSTPIELLTVNEDFYKTIKLDYHGGEKYPVLVCDVSKTNWISEIIKPRAPEIVADKK